MVDPAFVSRVNLGMAFPELDYTTRLKIWKKVLDEAKDKSGGVHELLKQERALEEWANKPLNGRQIRNVIHSARLLTNSESESKSGILTKKVIDECLQDVISFSK